MANEEQVKLLKRGVKEWNEWRKPNPFERPDLREADLRGVNLQEANLKEARLAGADLSYTNLSRANLRSAVLQKANFQGANLEWTHLLGANLEHTHIRRASFRGASLRGARLGETFFQEVILREVIFKGATLRATIFTDVDLRGASGLESVEHKGPSYIDVDTLIKSGGCIPETFLRGCGVPDSWIEYMPALIGSLQPIEYYSCFISYSTKDEAFAQRLHGRLQQEHVRVWYAPHDLKIDKLYPQIDDAIRVYDKLLLILSDDSIRSNWVETELRLALAKERAQNRRVLFRVRLTDYDALMPWRCFDADTGSDMAVDVRSYYIGDFSTWKNHDAFEKSFARLLSDLKATAEL